ncbi:MAG: FAD binding domain-containing protein, partial [Gemmatimonadetes bacterium]|nr:FAD binding domain-containing protein [Gemmatimonadota bacterium]
LAHADPASELPAGMLALGGSFRVKGPSGEREIAVEDFYTGLFGTALEGDEMLVEVEIPTMAPNTGWAFQEVSRRHGDFALAGIAAAVTVDEEGRCKTSRIALFGVGDAPVMAREAGALLEGQRPTPEAIREAAQAAAQRDVDPPADIHASADYRRSLVEVLVRRALPIALERAGAHHLR